MQWLSLDKNVLIFFMVVVLLATVSMSLKKSGRTIIKSIFKIALAGVFIYIFNLIGGKLGSITIPFNPITVLIAGILELPGVALILIMKYIIYP